MREWLEKHRAGPLGTILPGTPHSAVNWVASASPQHARGGATNRRQGQLEVSGSARGVLAGYAGAMAVLVIANFALPGLHLVLWSAIGYASVAAILLGVHLHRPRRRAPWLLLAAAVACF